jgi:hypothetical protein
MSRDADIQIILAAELNHNTVKIILERGEFMGCKYVEKNHHFVEMPSSFITPLEATDYIMKGIREEEGVGFEKLRMIPSVTFQYQDTLCNFILGKWHTSGTSILCDMFNGVYWFKGDPDDEMIDWARYIQLVLALCQDFRILELKTDDTNFKP